MNLNTGYYSPQSNDLYITLDTESIVSSNVHKSVQVSLSNNSSNKEKCHNNIIKCIIALELNNHKVDI